MAKEEFYMNKFFEKSILDELYEAKCEDFADSIQQEMQEERNSFLAEEELTSKIKEVVKDEKECHEVLKRLNKYELEVGREEDFWNKMFYKLGFYNSSELRKLLQDKVEDDKKTNEVITFIDSYTSDFLDYLEKNKRASLIDNNEYKEILNQIEKIKVANPNVRAFLEDKETVNLSEQEQKEVLKIFELNDELQIIELKIAFKLGIKETINFFKQMNMI